MQCIPHPSESLSIIGIHVDGPFAIFDRRVVIVHLAVSGSAVAVENGTARVQLDGSANKQNDIKFNTVNS